MKCSMFRDGCLDERVNWIRLNWIQLISPVNSVFWRRSSSTSGFNLLFCLPIAAAKIKQSKLMKSTSNLIELTIITTQVNMQCNARACKWDNNQLIELTFSCIGKQTNRIPTYKIKIELKLMKLTTIQTTLKRRFFLEYVEIFIIILKYS